MRIGRRGSAAVGTSDLFLADSRLAFLLLNDLRHRSLQRVFGTSREADNMLTVVLGLTAASAGYQGARRLIRGPYFGVSGTGVGVGALALREAGIVVAGPRVAATPMFGTLVAGALVAGLALPSLRRAMHAARLAEHRVREHRIARYVAAAVPRPTT